MASFDNLSLLHDSMTRKGGNGGVSLFEILLDELLTTCLFKGQREHLDLGASWNHTRAGAQDYFFRLGFASFDLLTEGW